MERAEIRMVTKQNYSKKISIPPNIKWNEGDKVSIRKIDENNIHIQRLADDIFDFPALSKEEQELEDKRIDKMLQEEYENDLKMNDGGIAYYTHQICQMCTNTDETLSCEYMKNFEVPLWKEGDDHTELLDAINLCRIEQGYDGDYKAEKYEQLKKDWRW